MTTKNRYLAETEPVVAREDLHSDERGNPTPEQRAEFIVRELEEFIRKNRTVGGMSFSEWQDMAKKKSPTR